MRIELGKILEIIKCFQTDTNRYIHNDMGISNDRAILITQRSESIVYGFLGCQDDWETTDCVAALLQDIENHERELSMAEAFFFILHGYSILMENLEHETIISFNQN